MSGAGSKDVEGAIKQTSELYPYLSWLDSFVINRRRTKGNVECSTGERGTIDLASEMPGTSDSDEVSLVDLDTSSMSTDEVPDIKPKQKWAKKSRVNKRTVDDIDLEMVKCISQIAKRPGETPKDPDELFGNFVASELKNMAAEQKAMAKFNINQLCFQIKIPSMAPSVFNNSQVTGNQRFHYAGAPHCQTPEQILLPFDCGNVSSNSTFST